MSPQNPEPKPQKEKSALDADELNARLTRIEDALQALSEGREESPVQKEEPNALDDLEQKLKGEDPQAVRDAALSIIDGLKPIIARLPEA